MKTTNASLLAIGILAAAAAGCTQKDDTTISFERLSVEQAYRLKDSAADYDVSSDLSFGCKADVLLPENIFGKSATTLRDSILTLAFGHDEEDGTITINLKDSPRDIAISSLREFEGQLGFALADTVIPADSLSSGFVSRFDGFAQVDGYIQTLTPDILSYGVTSSCYMPRAAHGMYSIFYLNYYIDRDEIVTLDKLFTPEGLAELPAIIRRTAQVMQPMIGTTDVTALPSRNNFYISSDYQLVFCYQPYEVASYAQGEIRIPVEAYLVGQYLTPTGEQILLAR